MRERFKRDQFQVHWFRKSNVLLWMERCLKGDNSSDILANLAFIHNFRKNIWENLKFCRIPSCTGERCTGHRMPVKQAQQQHKATGNCTADRAGPTLLPIPTCSVKSLQIRPWRPSKKSHWTKRDRKVWRTQSSTKVGDIGEKRQKFFPKSDIR